MKKDTLSMQQERCFSEKGAKKGLPVDPRKTTGIFFYPKQVSNIVQSTELMFDSITFFWYFLFGFIYTLTTIERIEYAAIYWYHGFYKPQRGGCNTWCTSQFSSEEIDGGRGCEF